MTETKILFIRHGETEENMAGKIQGRQPGHLTEKGRRQAAECAHIFKNEKPAAVYTSDLKRAAESARIAVKAAGLSEAILDSRLREPDNYGLAGHDRRAAFRAVLTRGASPEERKEVLAFIEDIRARHSNSTVAAFTHFGPTFVVLTEYSDMKSDDIIRKVPPGAIVVLRINENGQGSASFFSSDTERA